MSTFVRQANADHDTSFTLRADIKAKWLIALRSGEYNQGEGNLRAPDKEQFCCLGVLASVCGIPHESLSYVGMPSNINNGEYNAAGFDNKFTVHDPVQGESVGLADMNDNGYEFVQLADIIEAQVETFNDEDLEVRVS